MTISKPKVTVNIIPAALEVQNTNQKVLMIGTMLAGTATPLTLVQNIQNDHSENALFGANSMLAQMVREFKKLNPVTRIDAIPVANGAGASASAIVAITGPATANGTLEVSIGSAVNHQYEVPVAAGDTATTIGAALAGLINADADAPFTAVNTTGSVALTADNKGTEANSFALIASGVIPAGVGVVLTGWANGATNPVITGIFDIVQGQRYQTVVMPGTWATSVMVTELNARFNEDGVVLDGVGVITLVDTIGNHETALAALNSQSLFYGTIKKVADTLFKSGSIAEIPYVISAQIAAIRSLRLTQDADISQYTISTNGARDSFGGPALASFPYFNTPFPNLPLEAVGKGWTQTEQDQLKAAGGSCLGNNIANDSVIAGEFVTTYKNDNAGNPDPTFKNLEAVDTASNCREYFANNLRSRFAQSRLTPGDLVPNRQIANPGVIESYLDKLYSDLSGEDFVLTQAGAAALKFFKDNRVVTLDMVNGKAIVTMQTPIVVQLREIIASMQIAFSTG